MIHEDDRRILEDWPEAKIITAKTDCILGNHYHMKKTEIFILTIGEAILSMNGTSEFMKLGFEYKILPGQKHTFQMKAGSRMIGICSQAFDPTDDYR